MLKQHKRDTPRHEQESSLRIAFGALLAAAVAALAAAAFAATPPQARLVSATAVGDRVTLTFTRALAPATPAAVRLTVNGTAVRPSRVVTSGRRLTLVLPQAVYGDDAVAVTDQSVRSRDRKRVRYFSRTAANASRPGCTLDTEGPLDPASALATRRFSVLSVSADFADAPGGLQPLRLGGIDTWIRELSYGRAFVEGVERSGAVRMPKGFRDYAFTGPWGGRKAFYQDLVLSLDAEVDFSRYDAVFVTYTRRRDTPIPPTDAAVLAPAGSGVVADGKELRHFGAFSSAQPADGLAALLQLAGLRKWSPDQTTVWRGAVAERFLRPLGMLGWDRRKLGWLDPTQVRCPRAEPLDVTLAPLALPGGVKMVVVPLAGQALLVLENRQRVGLDAAHCKGGILAYEVQPVTPYRLRVVPAERRTFAPCDALAYAPYDLRPRDSATVSGITFEVVDIHGDGSYQLRVRRA